MASVLVFALAPVTKANISPQGGPAVEPAATANSTSAEEVQLPVVSIHSAGNIPPGKDRFIRAENEPCSPTRSNFRQLQGQRDRYPRS